MTEDFDRFSLSTNRIVPKKLTVFRFELKKAFTVPYKNKLISQRGPYHHYIRPFFVKKLLAVAVAISTVFHFFTVKDRKRSDSLNGTVGAF
jgi:hypothetical protein